ncbi:hypothetical protein BGZ58_000620 [Dissophora ornata]|nr:hypothetical protein BGZ58_000620 [Dissophora ornata]
MDSTSTPRTIQPRTLGLRRPNYGPMEHRVLKRIPTTPHVTRRRTVVDENLLVALHQTHIGHQLGARSSIANDSGGANEDADQPSPEQTVGTTLIESPFGTGANVDQVWAATDAEGLQYMPQTPRRESRTFTMAPGSGRRTPRRRSRSSNQHSKATPLKALADANQARVNRLISEANRRGRVGRDKHSPMGILRILSRIPGFNPPPQPAPDRQPIPGSSEWRKLTPKSQRTNYLQLPDDPNNPFSATTSHASDRDSYPNVSRIDRRTMSIEERLAYDKFKGENPFLDLDDINRLWEDGRKGQIERFSFGMGNGRRGEFLGEDGDMREFSVTQGDLTNPFQNSDELEFDIADAERRVSINVGDITNNSQRGFEQSYHGDQYQDQSQAVDQDQMRYRAQGTHGISGDEYSGRTAEPGSSTLLPELNQTSVAISPLGPEASEGFDTTPDSQSQVGVFELAESNTGQDDHNENVSDTYQQADENDINMEDEWEDILDDENAEGGAYDIVEEEQRTSEGTPFEIQEDDMIDADTDMNAGEEERTQAEEEMALEGLLQGEKGMNLEDLLPASEKRASAEGDPRAGNPTLTESEMSDGGRSATAENMIEESHTAVGLDQATDGRAPEGERQNREDRATTYSDVDTGDQAVVGDDQQDYDDGYMNVNDEDHIEQQEHEEQQDRDVHYFEDFPSELGIMSNGMVLPTSAPAPKNSVRISRAGITVPSMPISLQKQLIHTFSRSKISQEAMAVILEGYVVIINRLSVKRDIFLTQVLFELLQAEDFE